MATKNKKRQTHGKTGIEAPQGRLRLRLSRRLTERHDISSRYVNLGIPDTQANRVKAEKIAHDIDLDALTDHFDPSLVKYLGADRLGESSSSTLMELWQKYSDYRANFIEKSTLKRDYHKIQVRIASFPTQDPKRAEEIVLHLLQKFSRETARRTLQQLKACCDWALERGMIRKNPFENFLKDFKTPKKRKKPDSFTCAEMQRIIEAFTTNRFCPKKSAYKHSVYASYVSFLFFTGCRPEEAIALKWKHIRKDVIEFKEAYQTDLKIQKTTKTDKPRTFPINPQLRTLLDEIAPKDRNPNRLVFGSQTGQEIHQGNFVRRYWQKILDGLVEAGEVRKRLTPYHCRHTFITLNLKNNIPIQQVAEWVGNTPEMILKHYASTDSDYVPVVF